MTHLQCTILYLEGRTLLLGSQTGQEFHWKSGPFSWAHRQDRNFIRRADPFPGLTDRTEISPEGQTHLLSSQTGQEFPWKVGPFSWTRGQDRNFTGRADPSPGPSDRTGISALKSDAGYFQDGLTTRMASVIQSVFTKAGQIVFFSSPH